jgi:hypothetical protein
MNIFLYSMAVRGCRWTVVMLLLLLFCVLVTPPKKRRERENVEFSVDTSELRNSC